MLEQRDDIQHPRHHARAWTLPDLPEEADQREVVRAIHAGLTEGKRSTHEILKTLVRAARRQPDRRPGVSPATRPSQGKGGSTSVTQFLGMTVAAASRRQPPFELAWPRASRGR